MLNRETYNFNQAFNFLCGFGISEDNFIELNSHSGMPKDTVGHSMRSTSKFP